MKGSSSSSSRAAKVTRSEAIKEMRAELIRRAERIQSANPDISGGEALDRSYESLPYKINPFVSPWESLPPMKVDSEEEES